MFSTCQGQEFDKPWVGVEDNRGGVGDDMVILDQGKRENCDFMSRNIVDN